MTGAPLTPPDEGLYPGKVVLTPPQLFTVSVSASFANLSFEDGVQLKKVLDENLKTVGVALFKPEYIRVEFQPRHLSSTISDQNGF